MRIVAGKYKRRALLTPEGVDITRPTSDRARESLFKILTPRVLDACILDLFAGSGALGIEALSRGARRVVFVECHPEALRCLSQNLLALKIPSENYFVARCKVEEFLDAGFRKSLKGWKEEEFAVSADLVFADPPYALSWYDRCVRNLEGSRLCTSDCLLVVEMSSRKPAFVQGTPHWNLVDERIYGAGRLEFWQRSATELLDEKNFVS